MDQGSHHKHENYDYIIHDVFTGGAEPVELFTEEFLAGLSQLLHPEGVIAIVSMRNSDRHEKKADRSEQNYAGDLSSASTRLVVSTVKVVFPHCRFFREEAAPEGPDPINNPHGGDFTNMVMFCRKSGVLDFRDPVEADFLGSQARRHHLSPKHEIDAEIFDNKPAVGVEVRRTLKRGQTRELEALQRDSAVAHWHIMRTVLPAAVWENW